MGPQSNCTNFEICHRTRHTDWQHAPHADRARSSPAIPTATSTAHMTLTLACISNSPVRSSPRPWADSKDKPSSPAARAEAHAQGIAGRRGRARPRQRTDAEHHHRSLPNPVQSGHAVVPHPALGRPGQNWGRHCKGPKHLFGHARPPFGTWPDAQFQNTSGGANAASRGRPSSRTGPFLSAREPAKRLQTPSSTIEVHCT